MPSNPMLRLSNIESLRLLAFAMIVTDHVSWSGVTLIQTSDPNWFFSLFLNILSRFGVDLFVLIGAYFMCSKTLSTGSIAKRWWKILYPAIILLGAVYLLSPPLSPQQVLDDSIMMFQGVPVSIQGVWLGHLWFIYPYLILIAISPILNYAINAMEKETHKKAIIGLAGLFILVPTINALVAMPFLYSAGGPILTFVSLYFVAGYIKKYDVRIAPIKGVAITIGIIAAIFAISLVYTLIFHVPTPDNPNEAYTYFFGDSLLPVFAGSIFLFVTFRSIDFKSKIISLSGKLTYEAYLIHPVVWYLVMLSWPVSFIAPYTGVSVQIIITIVLVTSISMMYALSRYLMDVDAARVWDEVKLIASSEGGILGRVKGLSFVDVRKALKER